MLTSEEQNLPDCHYDPNQPTLIQPNATTPHHSLYLSNLDDQNFLRFTIKYLYLFNSSVSIDLLKLSLSSLLVHYYPLAGRLTTSKDDDDHKLEVDCNGQGAVFATGFMDITADDVLTLSKKPNRSWRKLLFKVDARRFLDLPPLVIQVTRLRCGGMILCTAINHCLCDGIGTSQFLQAWAHVATKPNQPLPIKPIHTRHVLEPRNPPQVKYTHHTYTSTQDESIDINRFLQSQPLIPVSITFTASHILHLKRQSTPSIKCTTFEALASHTWRSWVKSLDYILSPSQTVKLLFSVNVRKKLIPEIPEGYYGNGFVLGCAKTTVSELMMRNLYGGIKLVQEAKESLSDEYVRSMVDLLEDKTVKTDLAGSLVISQWSKLGLEDLDFGGGKAVYMGPVTSDIYCLFLPVVGDFNGVRVLVSLPESVVAKFEYYMMGDFSENVFD